MTTTDYLIDSALVLLVLLQIKERPLTTKALSVRWSSSRSLSSTTCTAFPPPATTSSWSGVLALLGLVDRRRQRPDRDDAARPRTARSSPAPAGRRGSSGCSAWARGLPSRSGSATVAPRPSASSAPSTRSPAARPGRRPSWPWRCSRCAVARSSCAARRHQLQRASQSSSWPERRCAPAPSGIRPSAGPAPSWSGADSQ